MRFVLMLKFINLNNFLFCSEKVNGIMRIWIGNIWMILIIILDYWFLLFWIIFV